eukprot:505029-Pelagomonas_calceolata.AAC.1
MQAKFKCALRKGSGYREKEGFQSKRLTANLKTCEKIVYGEWQASQEPPERKSEIERVEGQGTGKHIHAGEAWGTETGHATYDVLR